MSIVANLKVNRIGGNYNEWWNMWFNAIIHVEPYQRVIIFSILYVYLVKKNLKSTAWLSSVRALTCVIKFIQRTQSYPDGYNVIIIISKLKSSPHDLSMLGYTRITKIKTKKFNKVIWRNFQKLS